MITFCIIIAALTVSGWYLWIQERFFSSEARFFGSKSKVLEAELQSLREALKTEKLILSNRTKELNAKFEYIHELREEISGKNQQIKSLEADLEASKIVYINQHESINNLKNLNIDLTMETSIKRLKITELECRNETLELKIKRLTRKRDFKGRFLPN